MEATPDPERQFLIDHLNLAFEEAKTRMVPWYLGSESAARFNDLIALDIVSPGGLGQEIPRARYDGRDHSMHLKVKPESVLEYAEFLVDDTELAKNDVLRALIGAGVARCVIGWKLLPIRLGENEDNPRRHELQEKLCEKGPLLSMVEEFDNVSGTHLLESVERLGDAQMTEVNVTRFSVGASLNHMTDVIGWPPLWTPVVRQELAMEEHARQLDLRTALAVFEADSAFQLYDDHFPELLVALNFPMTPAEELNSFAAESYD